MTLVQAWKDSLSLLKPKNFKLFALVTLKSIIEAYKLLAKYWWWLFILMGFSLLLPPLFIAPFSHLIIFRLSPWIYQIILFATIVATRPSLEQKNCAYFRHYMVSFLLIMPLLLLLPQWAWPNNLDPFYFFMFLFYLDSFKWSDLFASAFKSIKMIIYNFPLLFILGIILSLPGYIFESYVSISPLLVAGVTLSSYFSVKTMLTALLLPITACVFTNIYIKKLHDQFDLYFKQPN